MNGGSRIIDLRRAAAPVGDGPSYDPVDDADHEALYLEPVDHEEPVGRDWTSFAVVGGVAASALWLAAMLWLSRAELPLLAPTALAGFIAALCVPPVLVGVLLLLLLRTSRGEARRFARTAQAMRDEAAGLERTVATIARTLDANQRTLAEQTAQLSTLGEDAAARLETVGVGMREQTALADHHAATLSGTVAEAQAAMTTLLGDLPRARDEAVAATRLLDDAGALLDQRAVALDDRFLQLADHGRDADRIALASAETLGQQLVRIEGGTAAAGQKLTHVVEAMAQGVDDVLHRTSHAMDEARRGMAAQHDALLAMTGAHQGAIERSAAETTAALGERIALIEAAIERIAARLGEERDSGHAFLSDLDQGIDATIRGFTALGQHGSARAQELAASISALDGSAEAMRATLAAGDSVALATIATTDRLLVAMDAAAREIDETLPDALTRLDRRIHETRHELADVKPELLALVTAAESTHDAIGAIAGVVAEQRIALDRLTGDLLQALGQGRGQVDQLDAVVGRSIDRAQDFAVQVAPQLVEALLRVRETANAAAERAHETLAAVIPQAAAALESASSAALARAATGPVDRRIAAIGDAAEAAAASAERASDRLTRQMQTLAGATALIETRFAEQRADRDQAERDSFPRRMGVLIDALNSSAIDVTRAFSTDVADSAWAAYLKGDRGVFTRRAVRLLDGVDAREIARLHDSDPVFREQVNRYIHDFEAMLRQVLAGGEGSPIGVTLLSSDVGKLYVALAQAIERLRS